MSSSPAEGALPGLSHLGQKNELHGTPDLSTCLLSTDHPIPLWVLTASCLPEATYLFPPGCGWELKIQPALKWAWRPHL
jgi:hypothetical protein